MDGEKQVWRLELGEIAGKQRKFQGEKGELMNREERGEERMGGVSNCGENWGDVNDGDFS